MIFFLDCEYIEAIRCDLFSIGMVSEDGQHSFYAERNNYEHTWCNAFVQHCIQSLQEAIAHRTGWLAWADADKIKKGSPHD